MHVALLQGHCKSQESSAYNDFEAMSIGDTSTLYGEDENNGATLGEARFTIRA